MQMKRTLPTGGPLLNMTQGQAHLTVLPLSQRPHPVSDCLSDLIRIVLLKEVKPAHGYLCLRRPAPAELPRGLDQNAPRLTVHEQLGNGTVREPLGVGAHDPDHVGGFPIQRDLARPGEYGTAPLARLGKWATVVRHLPLGQATQDLPGQDLFFPCAPPMASQAKKATFLWNWFIVCSSLASICAIIREDNRSVGWSRLASPSPLSNPRQALTRLEGA